MIRPWRVAHPSTKVCGKLLGGDTKLLPETVGTGQRQFIAGVAESASEVESNWVCVCGGGYCLESEVFKQSDYTFSLQPTPRGLQTRELNSLNREHHPWYCWLSGIADSVCHSYERGQWSFLTSSHSSVPIPLFASGEQGEPKQYSSLPAPHSEHNFMLLHFSCCRKHNSH